VQLKRPFHGMVMVKFFLRKTLLGLYMDVSSFMTLKLSWRSTCLCLWTGVTGSARRSTVEPRVGKCYLSFQTCDLQGFFEFRTNRLAQYAQQLYYKVIIPPPMVYFCFEESALIYRIWLMAKESYKFACFVQLESLIYALLTRSDVRAALAHVCFHFRCGC
jgi:hypothetical protein